jgi:hypothetical protein
LRPSSFSPIATSRKPGSAASHAWTIRIVPKRIVIMPMRMRVQRASFPIPQVTPFRGYLRVRRAIGRRRREGFERWATTGQRPEPLACQAIPLDHAPADRFGGCTNARASRTQVIFLASRNAGCFERHLRFGHDGRNGLRHVRHHAIRNFRRFDGGVRRDSDAFAAVIRT